MNIRKRHHEKEEYCMTRPKYRSGRRPKAVKVYTVSQESIYLLIRGISSVNGSYEGLVEKLKTFGEVVECKLLPDYPKNPSETFTNVALVKYTKLVSARIAKMRLDDLNYMGESLHLCYAPEFESVEECRDKLEVRRRAVLRKIAVENASGDTSENPNTNGSGEIRISNSEAKTGLLPVEEISHHPTSINQSLNNMFPSLLPSFTHPFPPLLPPPPHHHCPNLNHFPNQPIPTHHNHQHSAGPSFQPNSVSYPGRTNPDACNNLKQDNFSTLKNFINRPPKTSNVPPDKFNMVPRQVARPRQITITTATNKISCNHGNPTIDDRLLREQALQLQDETFGPNMEDDEEESKRKMFKKSLTGDVSIDNTVMDIRRRVNKM